MITIMEKLILIIIIICKNKGTFGDLSRSSRNAQMVVVKGPA